MATRIWLRNLTLIFLTGILLLLPPAGPVSSGGTPAVAGSTVAKSSVPDDGLQLRTPPIYGVPEGELFDRPGVFRTVIVGLRKGEPLDQTLVTARGGEVRNTFSFINSYSARVPETAIPQLATHPAVEYVDADVDKPSGSVLAQTPDWGIAHVKANEHHGIGSRGAGIRVAVLDTGIDLDHPDVDGNLDPANLGWDFVNNDGNADDDNGHGTSVAAVIAAEDNSIGVLGVAPQATLYAVKVANSSGQWQAEHLLQGIQWASQNGMDIINMSLGSAGYYASVKAATDAAYNDYGILIVAAVGNDGDTEPVVYPARFDSVIGVGAIDSSNALAWFSNRGPEVELVAPGVNVRSAWTDGYATGLDGTSYSTPYVSGVAALVMSSPIDPHFDLDGDGAWDADEVRKRLAATADDLGLAGKDSEYGYGLVDARRFDASVSAGGGGAYWQSSARAVDGRLETHAWSDEFEWESYAEAFVRSTFVAQATVVKPEFVYTLYEKGRLQAWDPWSLAKSYGRIKLTNGVGSTLFTYQPVLHSLQGVSQSSLDETHKVSYAWSGTLTVGQVYTVEVGLRVETYGQAIADFSASGGGADFASIVWSPAPYESYADGFGSFYDALNSTASVGRWGADPVASSWLLYAGQYVEGSGGRSELVANADYARNGAVEAEVALVGGEPGTPSFAGLVARWRKGGSGGGWPQYLAVWLHNEFWGGGIRLEQWRETTGWTQYADVAYPVTLEVFYKVRVELQGQHVRVLVNDQVKIDGVYGIDDVSGQTGLTVATTPGRFKSFWSSGLDGWSFPSGNWMATGGMNDRDPEDERLSQSDAGDNRRAVLEGLDLTDFIYSATINLKVKDNWGTGLTFRMDASGYGYVLCFRTSTIELWKERGLGQGQKAVYSFSALENTDYTLKVRATGNKFTFYRDGVLLGTWTDPYNDLDHGYVGFDAANATHFDNVSII